MVKVVVTRPNHELATAIGYAALEPVVLYYFQKYETIDLKSSLATKEEVRKYLPCNMFFGVGHGADNVFTGWLNEIIFYVCEDHRLQGALIYLLSCLTAQRLGYDFIDKGARSYIGYYDLFWFGCEDILVCVEDPYQDTYAKWFFVPVKELLLAIADGATMKSAFDISMSYWNEAIAYWEINPEDDPNAGIIVTLLIIDRDGQRLYGDPDARLAPGLVLTASTSSTYEDRAEIFDIFLQATVASEYTDKVTVSVRRRATWFYYLPAVGTLVYGLTREEREEKKKITIAGTALGIATAIASWLTKPKFKPYVPPGIVLRSSVISEYVDKAYAKPPIKLYPEVASTYEERVMVVGAIPVRPETVSEYVDVATATPAVLVEAVEVFSSYTEARASTRVYVEAYESFGSSTSARVARVLRVEPSVISEYSDLVNVVRSISIRPEVSSSYVDTATAGVATTVSATESFGSSVSATVKVAVIGVRPSVLSQYVDTATLTITKPPVELYPSVSSSYADSAVLGATLSISATDSLTSSTSATISIETLPPSQPPGAP